MEAVDGQPEEVPWYVNRGVTAARRDPRLDHGREAVIADWWGALQAAERTRRLADWGLAELRGALAREEERTGFRVGDPRAPAEVQRGLKAAWERTDLAIAEGANQTAEVNAMTLVTLVGALDSMVEELGPIARDLRVRMLAQQLFSRAEEEVSRKRGELPPYGEETRVILRETLARMLDECLPNGKKLGGVGAYRWERVLSGAGLNAQRDRPIPDDLNETLCEVVALRHVIAHNASRVDVRALRSAPSLAYSEGDLVRITQDDYRRYAAALRTYAEEVIRRFMLPVAPHDVYLTNWQLNVPPNT